MIPLAKLNLSNTEDLKIHELADVFPMFSEDELQALTDDIKENGLNNPIVIKVIDGEDYLIDGRNRLAACRLANIEPTFVEWMGDIANFIYSENVSRRHLTISQAAIGEALLFPKGRQTGRKKINARDTTGIKNIGESTMRYARKLVDPENNATDLVEQVKKGPLTVGAAYKELTNRQGGYNAIEIRLKELKENAPDLAELVSAGKDLNEMHNEYREREEADRLSKISVLNEVRSLNTFLRKIKNDECAQKVISAINSKHLAGVSPDDVYKNIEDSLESLKTLKRGIENARKN